MGTVVSDLAPCHRRLSVPKSRISIALGRSLKRVDGLLLSLTAHSKINLGLSHVFARLECGITLCFLGESQGTCLDSVAVHITRREMFLFPFSPHEQDNN